MNIGEFIPVSERWLHDPTVLQDLNAAIARAEEHPLRNSYLIALESRMNL